MGDIVLYLKESIDSHGKKKRVRASKKMLGALSLKNINSKICFSILIAEKLAVTFSVHSVSKDS